MKKVLLGVLVLALAYAGAATFVASRFVAASRALQVQNAEISALGEKVAEQVRNIDASGPSLQQACAGKLVEGAPRSLVAYALESTEAEGSPRIAKVIYALTEGDGGYLDQFGMPATAPAYGWDVGLAHALSPDDWPRELERASGKQALYAQLRYVVVSHFSELTPATVRFDAEGKNGAYDAGHARYRARVIAFPSGETVCEGSGDGIFEQKEVVGHGTNKDDARTSMLNKLSGAWMQATIASPLHVLCAVGGKALCSATDLAVDAPDW